MTGDIARALARYGIAVPPGKTHFQILCPVHQEKTASCDVDLEKGVWHCFGCGKGGDGIALVMQREGVTFPEALRSLGIDNQGGGSTARPPSLPPTSGETTGDGEEDREAIDAARRLYAACRPLPDTPAQFYAETRGVSYALAETSGARYCPDFLRGGPALVFPVTDQAGEVTAVQGRYVFPASAGSNRPDKKTRGRLWGVYCTAGALDQREVIITEAPLDALSLAVCGFPAIALLGTKYPAWLPAAIGTRRAYLATDNDGAGDGAAERLYQALAKNGGEVYRLNPKRVKDWNEHLCTYGPAVMEAALIAAAFPERRLCVPLPVVDLAPELSAGVSVILSDGTGATVQRYHGPEPDFPAGWAEIQTSDGRRRKADCRGLRNTSGTPFVYPYELLTWREKIDRARDCLETA